MLKIEFRCILFPLILVEMFLQPSESLPVVNPIDWTWFGKAHTCLFKVPQVTMQVGAQIKQANLRRGTETRLIFQQDNDPMALRYERSDFRTTL